MQWTVCGPRVAGLLDELLGLDHLLDPRPPRVVGDVDDVDARGAEAGHDQVRAIGPVAGGAAAVPAEVVQLVADVRHRRLVDDPAVLGVDDGEEVGRVDAGALVQAGEVEELLRRRLQRLGRRGVERLRLVVMVLHGSSFGSIPRGEERVLPASSRRSRSRLTRLSRAANVGLTRARIRGVEFELLGPLRVVDGWPRRDPGAPQAAGAARDAAPASRGGRAGRAADRGAVGRGAARDRADRAARARLRAAQAARRRADQDAPARLPAARHGRRGRRRPGSSRWSRRRASAHDPDERSAGLREALALWRGEPLAELRYEAFAEREIARLEELRLAALEERVDADLALGRHHELVRGARAARRASTRSASACAAS